MLEDKNKFFLHDRWFYFKKETTNKITYTSMIDDSKNGVIIILDKNTNEVEIIALKDEEFVAKLYISNIKDKVLKFHYKESMPQNIYIENDLYVNLLLEAFIETNYGRIDKESMIRISKKKNLDKIVYLTPPVPLDEDIYMDKYKIKSDMLDYFLELINSFSVFSKKLLYTNTKEEIEEETKDEISNINNLEVPESIFVYDRQYKFVNKEYSAVNYINDQDGENKLRIKFDPNLFYLTGFTLDTTNRRNQQYRFSAMYTDNNKKVLVAFGSNEKVPIQLSYQESLNSHIVFEGTYNENADPLDISVKIEKNNTMITLTSHPVFSNAYVDENGQEYRLSNQDFSKLSGIAAFSPYILKSISDTMVKKK